MEQSVSESLEALEPDARDTAARDLAVTYARELDLNPDQLADLGPKLLSVLDALGMTPKARSAAVKGGSSATARNPLDELRARRADRAGNGSAPSLDAS